jgi:hypothetical protein
MLTVAINASAPGANEVLPAVAGSKYRVVAFVLTYAGTVAATWASGGDALTGALNGAAGSSCPSPALPPRPGGAAFHFETATGQALNMNLSGAVAVSGYAVYEKVPGSL